MITVTELTATECSAWDAYVKNTAYGLPQHLSGWQNILYKTNKYETHYLLAREDWRIVGVLPLFLVRSILTGKITTTMPGGLCAANAIVAESLVARGKEIARQAKANRFILHDTRQAWPIDLHTSTHHVHWLIELGMEADALWKRLESNIRRQVRIAYRNDLTVEIDRTGKSLGVFYDVFSCFTHQLGTPIFGRNFLENVITTFPDNFSIAIVYKKRQPVGGYFQLEMGHTVHGVWGGSLREYLGLRPAYLAHWEILRDACERGCHVLDMGRSPIGSNVSTYKSQWGGVAKPIYQQVACFDNCHKTERVVSQVHSDGKFKLVRHLWPKLPLPVAQYLGPKLRRHIPFA